MSIEYEGRNRSDTQWMFRLKNSMRHGEYCGGYRTIMAQRTSEKRLIRILTMHLNLRMNISLL